MEVGVGGEIYGDKTFRAKFYNEKGNSVHHKVL